MCRNYESSTNSKAQQSHCTYIKWIFREYSIYRHYIFFINHIYMMYSGISSVHLSHPFPGAMASCCAALGNWIQIFISAPHQGRWMNINLDIFWWQRVDLPENIMTERTWCKNIQARFTKHIALTLWQRKTLLLASDYNCPGSKNLNMAFCRKHSRQKDENDVLWQRTDEVQRHSSKL